MISFPPLPYAVLGTGYSANNFETLQIFSHTLFIVDDKGFISSILPPTHENYNTQITHWKEQNKLVELPTNSYILPGFVDLHIHAPQFPQTGKALDLPLSLWLQENTFPLESKYSSLSFAHSVYSSLVSTLLSNGTTTAVYFATIHNEASLELAKICLEKGQRALVGRVAMDNKEECPEYYRDNSAKEAIDATSEFIDKVRELTGNEDKLVLPVVTPRFIPSCTDELLEGLGKLAKEKDCHVQTHCSESDWMHEYVKKRKGKNDAQALNDFGLLSRHTILAHSNFISDEDMELIFKKGSGVAHCPLSNFYFANSVFPLLYSIQQKNINVGLGTDISGGFSPSMLDSCRYSISSSYALNDGVNPFLSSSERKFSSNAKIDFRKAFWLATGGGGQVLDLPGFFLFFIYIYI